jgi:hypothetical protein
MNRSTMTRRFDHDFSPGVIVPATLRAAHEKSRRPVTRTAASKHEKLRFLREFDLAHGNLAAARVVLGIEAHLLAFAQSRDARAFKRRGVDEHVLVAAIRLDEAEAFLAVIEFHCSGIHGIVLSLWIRAAHELHERFPSSRIRGKSETRESISDEAGKLSRSVKVDGAHMVPEPPEIKRKDLLSSPSATELAEMRPLI